MRIKIVLADDHKIVREGLRSLLEKDPEMHVIGQADSGRAAVQVARKLRPDIVVMDVAMPDLNGMEATRQIKAEASSVKVVALSVHTDKRFVASMLRAGASGYLIKDCAYDELVTAIKTTVAGHVYLSPKIAAVVTEDYVRRLSSADQSVSSVLTPKEREVLQPLAEGKSTKQIADELHVSVKTVETHRQRIMLKLGVRSVAQLTKYAVREGLTSLED